MDETKMLEMKTAAYRVGVSVLILLIVLTAGEFLLGNFAYEWAAPLIGVAFLKAFLIVRDYMHLGRLFAGDEEAES
jgi:Prokaryotic Cytochrome C oxidase subunit IV